MKLTEEQILDRVAISRTKRDPFETKARVWESMWKLEAWDETLREAHEAGREQITLPDTLNIVHVAERLVRFHPNIDCPPTGDDEDTEEDRKSRSRFLEAVWQRNSRQQGKNILGHAWWMSLVRSRFAFQVKLTEDTIPKRMRKSRIPFHISVLDPLQCFFQHGEYYTEWAGYEYEEDVSLLEQKYPEFDFYQKDNKSSNKQKIMYGRPLDEGDVDSTIRKMVEFWYMDAEGYPWSCLLCDEQLLAEPERQDQYYRIPIIEVLGDDFPIKNEDERAHSILRPMEDLWIAQNRLVSQVATGLLQYYWPQYFFATDDTTIDLSNVGQGRDPMQVPSDTRILTLQGSPNLPISDRLLTLYETEQQQSSFPPALYGATQGDGNSGHAATVRQQAARGRVSKFMRNLEMGIEAVNELLLGFVDDSKKPVKLWGTAKYADRDGSQHYSISLSSEQVRGNYANSVSIEPDVPQEEIQKSTLALRYAETGVASKDTVRNISPYEFPEDEQERVFREQREEAVEQATNAAQAQILQMAAQIEAQKMQMAAQQQMQQEMMAQQQAMQPQGPMGPQMPGQMPQGPQGPQGMPMQGAPGVPQSPSMMGGGGSQQMEGQLTPEAMGGLDPAIFQMLANNPSLAEQLGAMNGDPREGRG